MLAPACLHLRSTARSYALAALNSGWNVNLCCRSCLGASTCPPGESLVCVTQAPAGQTLRSNLSACFLCACFLSAVLMARLIMCYTIHPQDVKHSVDQRAQP